jgi:hypothetical protein
MNMHASIQSSTLSWTRRATGRLLLAAALAGVGWSAGCIAGEADDTARVIAGMDSGPGKPGYAREISAHWGEYERRIGRAMRRWGCQELPGAKGATLFYPFSGPDLPSVYQLYPEADRYVLVSVQKAEAPPRLASHSGEELENYLAAFRKAWRFFGVLGFFRTDDLEDVANARGIRMGMTGPLMAFAVRLGFDIEAVEPIKFDRDGNDIVLRTLKPGEADAWDSVRLSLRKDGRKVLVDYVKLDLSDASLATSADVRSWVDRMAGNPALLKAASHLPQEPGFSILRDSMLAIAPSIVQDETGIEYDALARHFTVRLYGKFTRPNPSFDSNLQRSLAAAYRGGATAGKLPFPLGYEKKQGPAVQVAIRDAKSVQPRQCLQ